jgi:hypothetical protein
VEIKLLDVARGAVELFGGGSPVDHDRALDDAVESTSEHVEHWREEAVVR